MQKITPREVLRSAGFKTMSLGFGLAIIGVLFAATGLIPIAQWLVVLGIVLGFVGFAMHIRLFISTVIRKKK